jgi:hypothetical protein
MWQLYLKELSMFLQVKDNSIPALILNNSYPDFSKLKGVETDIQLQEYLRDMYKSKEGIGVAVVPGIHCSMYIVLTHSPEMLGSAFGMNPSDKFIRISCAQEISDLQSALGVIEHAIFTLMTNN